ncbi:MAG: DUF5678 domain-containing protein [Acidobacteria bacterium]|nr:DUF5678 domain-containing protein [Acidobacteriota bacterium]
MRWYNFAGKEYEVMSTITVENILKQIEELPFIEQRRLSKLLDDKLSKPDKEPQGQRAQPVPMPDYTGALQWLVDHSREYAGEWVALDGARLIAHSHKHEEVFAAADADGAYLPLLSFVEDPDKVYAGF